MLKCIGLIVGAIAASAQALPPDLHGISPPGAQRGVETGIGVHGARLNHDAELITPIRGKFTLQVPASRPAGAVSPIVFNIRIDDDMPAGIYPISVHTPSGITNRVLFSVSPWPNEAEKDPNDSIETAQPLKIPVVVNATLTPSDRDYFKFTGVAGQRLMLEVESARLGMGVDSAIELLDARGQQIAANDDAPGLGMDSRLDAVLPAAGDYFVQVHDAKFGAPPGAQYRLKIGRAQYGDGIFPLGGPRDGKVSVQLVGGNLDSPIEAALLPMNSPLAAWRTVSFSPDAAAVPMRFAVSDERELIEPSSGGAFALEPGVFVNGRISKPGEVDQYVLNVTPGQKWLFEVEAAELGSSQLDGVLTVYDEANHRLAMADDGGGVINMITKDIPNGGPVRPPFNGLDPKLGFDVPGGLRRIFLTVEDLQGHGGPAYGYRLRTRLREPDFSLRALDDRVNIPRNGVAIVRVAVDRMDYKGPVQLRIPRSFHGLTAEGGSIDGDSNEGILLLSARNEAPNEAFELSIFGQAGPAAQPWERRAVSVNVPSPNAPQIDLPAAVTRRLPVSITPEKRHIVLAHGQTVPVTMKVRRDAGADAEIPMAPFKYQAAPGGAPLQIGGKIAAKAAEGVINFSCTANDPLPIPGVYDIVLAGNLKVEGEDIQVLCQPVTVEVKRPFSARVLDKPAKIHADEFTRLVGMVSRVPPFDADVNIRLDGLPANVRAYPVTVHAGESTFVININADPATTPGVIEATLRASTPMPANRASNAYELPPVPVTVEIAARPAATQPATAPAAVK